MEVTGYFDENFYPAYYEDTEYLRRLKLLGFKLSNVPGFEAMTMQHFGGGSVLAAPGFTPASQLRDVVPFIRGSTFVIHKGFPEIYINQKYDLGGAPWLIEDTKEPYPGKRFPLDAFILDEKRNRAISELLRVAVWYKSLSPEEAILLRSPTAYMHAHNASLYSKLRKPVLNGVLYYRNGNALRLLPSLA
ncbi:beta galactofuranosyl glycosyle transferase [Leptomonas pyrrhocoris]|uniref:Beta galactofuranosyl glycosyle transferase n=1 Tax=Leptomonas pyrrhocoris TaxID=157538 RepID=A0A0M9G4N5_LEPPY|nr:beta galactofuranosyl glycosyle transferase [Leptomonas pyrrhocoris]KPA82049.1 beta galactofuranosyl glycosyle transferase [Leptomonas pyrrhocoris]|eukprot:XP_015660488.1 beta galactofuranosyl glycosyle transferase [Leptomonas pyrrhocoris]